MNRLELGVSDLILIAEYVIFLVIVFNKVPSCRPCNKGKAVGLLMVVIPYLACFILYPDKLLLFCILQMGCIVGTWMIFEKNLLESLKLWVISSLVLSLLESLVLSGFMVFIPQMGRFLQITGCTVLVCLLLVLYGCLLGRKMKGLLWNHQLWGVSAAALLLVVLMVSYFRLLISGEVAEKWIKTGAVLVTLGELAIFIILFSMLYYFKQKESYRTQSETSEKFNEQQREYFTRLLEREESTRQFRHDMMSHLIALKTLEEERQYDSLRQYLDELLEELDHLSRRQYDVGNEIINTILNYYLIPLQDVCRIRVQGYIGDTPHISQKDLCVLTSNVVHNAADAVMQAEDKRLEFVIEEGTEYVRLYVENTFSGKLTVDKSGVIRTTKTDQINHGIGMRNIRQMVDKYDGKQEIKAEDGLFRIEIFLHST